MAGQKMLLFSGGAVRFGVPFSTCCSRCRAPHLHRFPHICRLFHIYMDSPTLYASDSNSLPQAGSGRLPCCSQTLPSSWAHGSQAAICPLSLMASLTFQHSLRSLKGWLYVGCKNKLSPTRQETTYPSIPLAGVGEGKVQCRPSMVPDVQPP